MGISSEPNIPRLLSTSFLDRFTRFIAVELLVSARRKSRAPQPAATSGLFFIDALNNRGEPSSYQ